MSQAQQSRSQVASTADLQQRYQSVRRLSDRIRQPLAIEDCVIQSMPDVSPTRWHLAHTTWFFETFVLAEYMDGYIPLNDDFRYLFNSYYNAVGEQYPRPQRGLLSRPTVAEVCQYREYVDDHMERLFADVEIDPQISQVIEIGLNHEQQHQELMLTDIKHVLHCNPLLPAYDDIPLAQSLPAEPGWQEFDEGLYEIGFTGSDFSYDNESPRHRVFVERFQLAERLVNNGEFLEFMNDDGYRRPELWLSEGWGTVNQQGWRAPLYWIRRDDRWMQFTMAGLQPVDPHAPVCHISYFEADAYARWRGERLPTEAEWEIASEGCTVQGRFADDSFDDAVAIHPAADGMESTGSLRQMFGCLWQWTSSQYMAYPGYRPPPGALGEYNGKFMCNQFVLRGGSVATPRNHVRPTYRNFFPPESQWQFAGIRLAR